MGAIQRRMMLKPILTDVAHQVLQAGHFDDCPAAKCLQRIVYKHAVPHICLNNAVTVVCGHTRIAEGASRGAARNHAVGILITKCGTENRHVFHLEFRSKEALGPVTTMKQHTFVGIIGVVIVPIDQRAVFVTLEGIQRRVVVIKGIVLGEYTHSNLVERGLPEGFQCLLLKCLALMSPRIASCAEWIIIVKIPLPSLQIAKYLGSYLLKASFLAIISSDLAKSSFRWFNIRCLS